MKPQKSHGGAAAGAASAAAAAAVAEAAAASNNNSGLLANISTKICSMKLIQLVRRNEILYNNQADGFMDKTLKLEVWRRLERQLFPKYDCLNAKEKEIVHGHVKRRWKTLRNTIAREVKKNSSLENFVRKKESPIIAELEFLIPHIKSAHCAKLSDELGLRENYTFLNDHTINEGDENDDDDETPGSGAGDIKPFGAGAAATDSGDSACRRPTFDLTMEEEDDDDDDDGDVEDDEDGHGSRGGGGGANAASSGGGSDMDNTMPQAFYPTVQIHTNMSGAGNHTLGKRGGHGHGHHGHGHALNGGGALADDEGNDESGISPPARKKFRRSEDSAIAHHSAMAAMGLMGPMEVQARLLQLIDGLEKQCDHRAATSSAAAEQDNNDADRMFLLSLVSDLKRISPAKKMLVKAEIATVLARALQ